MSKDVWLNANAFNAGDLILTGYVGELKDMPVYEEVIDLCKNGKKALDFGCGVGRNTFALSKNYNHVIGYDLPSMISLVPEENKPDNVDYTSDWDSLKDLRFDMVLASLVLQHIEDQELNNYLHDLALMTDNLVLHSRTWIDHSNNLVLPIVEKYFRIDQINYTKDPNNPADDHFIGSFKKKG
jgi:2-polyprenyl-3-methyl-5-hydroxy-6-metoxy-1,4-benzoquinol methylase